MQAGNGNPRQLIYVFTLDLSDWQIYTCKNQLSRKSFWNLFVATNSEACGTVYRKAMRAQKHITLFKKKKNNHVKLNNVHFGQPSGFTAANQTSY